MSDESGWSAGMLGRKLFSEVDPAFIVVLAKDGEGNGFSPLADVTVGWYRPESTWSGEVLDDKQSWTPNEFYSTYEEYIKGAVPCLVLSPIN